MNDSAELRANFFLPYYLINGIALVVLWTISWRHGLSYLRKFLSIEDLYSSDFLSAACSAVTISLMYGVYLVAARHWFKDTADSKLSEKQVWIVCLVPALVALVSLPTNSKDVFYYLECGRMLALHGLNPYLHSYSEINDYFSSFAWHNQPMCYGPLILLIFVPAAWISHIDVALAIFFIKGSSFLFHAANITLIGRIAEQIGLKKRRSMFIYGANPIVIQELIANGHNDGFCILLVLASVMMLVKKRMTLSSVAALLVILVKPPFLIVTLVFVAFFVKSKQYLAIARIGFLGIGLVLLASLVFFPTTGSWAEMFNIRGLTYPYALPILLSNSWKYKGTLFELISPLQCVVVLHCGALFAFIGFRVKGNDSPQQLINKLCESFLILLLMCATLYWPWYSVWLMPWCALSNRRLYSFIPHIVVFCSQFLYLSLSPIFSQSFWQSMLGSSVLLFPLTILLLVSAKAYYKNRALKSMI